MLVFTTLVSPHWLFQSPKRLWNFIFKDLPADDESPAPGDALQALASMRTAETELRSRLRFLQVARLEGWEVATQFLKVTDGTTDDPAVIEARKAVAKNKKGKDEGNTPSKLGKNFAGQPTGNLNKWPRGRAQHQGPDYEQAVGYPFAGASAYPPLYYNFAAPQQYYGQQGPSSQWSPTLSQAIAPPPPPPTTFSAAGYIGPLPSNLPATATAREPPICFGCLQPGHIRQNCPDINKLKMWITTLILSSKVFQTTKVKSILSCYIAITST